ncbi:unnamed protein product [Lymnaea stagnalis]|uniref:Uncharacterized protein n=1 Tax=Lymnaea stagnalis TaxID=6523 RepID=A0AAV2HFP2_LYMST
MGCCNSFGTLVVSMLVLLVSLGLTIAAILTDYWFLVGTDSVASDESRRRNNFNFGFWKKCYEDMPEVVPSDEHSSATANCVTIYERLTDTDANSSRELVIQLSRSYIGLSITSAAAQLATILILLCGSWPGDCQRLAKPGLYITATFVLVIATMSGAAAGICFIAARDVERTDLALYEGLTTDYGWSFMLHWIGAGLCFLDGFLILFMLRFSYEEVNSKFQNLYYS